jgi:hypothetical protein
MGLSEDHIREVVQGLWSGWVDACPQLASFDPEVDVVQRRRLPSGQGGVLVAVFARLADRPSGGSPDAAKVLAWLMDPGAARLRRDVFRRARSGLGWGWAECTQRVAAAMWEACRSAGRLTGSVAFSLVSKARQQVWDDARAECPQRDPIGDAAMLPLMVDGWGEFTHMNARGVGAVAGEGRVSELRRVLFAAKADGQISDVEREVLVELVLAAELLPCRKRAGLSWNERQVVSSVAQRRRVPARCVQRIAERAVAKLSCAASAGLLQAA